VSKSLVFLLILAILGGGGYGTYYMLNQNGIDIPFLSDYLKPKVQDPGNLKMTTYDINSKFVDNASVGKLFVVSGKVKNGYAESRGMITLEGKIFSTGKVPVHSEKVYCGNVMSDLELANLEWDKIKERLINRLGDNRSNVKIEPGKSIPFMVVFSGLPEDLEEFTIEVTGSTALK
jgi:pilus assembly protein FimV